MVRTGATLDPGARYFNSQDTFARANGPRFGSKRPLELMGSYVSLMPLARVTYGDNVEHLQ